MQYGNCYCIVHCLNTDKRKMHVLSKKVYAAPKNELSHIFQKCRWNSEILKNGHAEKHYARAYLK
jgi:hypothetical protein